MVMTDDSSAARRHEVHGQGAVIVPDITKLNCWVAKFAPPLMTPAPVASLNRPVPSVATQVPEPRNCMTPIRQATSSAVIVMCRRWPRSMYRRECSRPSGPAAVGFGDGDVAVVAAVPELVAMPAPSKEVLVSLVNAAWPKYGRGTAHGIGRVRRVRADPGRPPARTIAATTPEL